MLEANPGLENVCKIVDVIETKHDLWIMYELSGKTLNSQMYNLCQEMVNTAKKLFIMKT